MEISWSREGKRKGTRAMVLEAGATVLGGQWGSTEGGREEGK